MDPIIHDELQHLEQVRTLLEEVPYVLPPKEADIVKELVRLREELPQAKEEDKGSLMEQYNQSYALLQQIREARERPQVDPDSPYFAHMRLVEGDRSRDIFLGKATRIQRGVRIVDWRNAPISRIFYAYQQGEEYEEEMSGRTHEGVMAARRTVTIRKGVLERVDAPEGSFTREPSGWSHTEVQKVRLSGGAIETTLHASGEGAHRRLGTDLSGARRRQDKRLPDIAGLIDPDQFDLITQPSSGFVVIRGTAGSGKTTVALHRIAYLAYQEEQINSRDTLFIVFSPALREYVSHVLPALGVEKVQVRDFRHWAAQQRQRHFPHLPKRPQLHTPEVVSRLKVHPAMLQVLEHQHTNVSGPSNGHQALDDMISALTNVDLLTEVLNQVDPGAFSRSELEKVTRWCGDRYEELMQWVEGDREVTAALDEEDDALLLRAWQLRVGPLRNKGKRPLRYRHVAVDEVQDFSPVDIRVLLDCLDRKQSITLAGDTQQHVMKDAGFTSWSSFFSHLGLEGTAVNTLRIAYRSSRQVVAFAMGLLGDLREDDTPPMVTREGPAVELFRFTDHGAAVAFLGDVLKDLLRDEPMASVVLLTPSPAMSGLYFAGLDRSEVPRLRRVETHNFSFAPGVEITEIDRVKGLEFDYVILVETSARAYRESPAARRLLHVGATRAVHQLWLTSVEDPSGIVTEALNP